MPGLQRDCSDPVHAGPLQRERLHTVGYADRDSSESFLGPLMALASGTGGNYFHSLKDPAEINEAMRIAYGDSLTLQDIKLGNLGTVSAGPSLFDIVPPAS